MTRRVTPRCTRRRSSARPTRQSDSCTRAPTSTQRTWRAHPARASHPGRSGLVRRAHAAAAAVAYHFCMRTPHSAAVAGVALPTLHSAARRIGARHTEDRCRESPSAFPQCGVLAPYTLSKTRRHRRSTEGNPPPLTHGQHRVPPAPSFSPAENCGIGCLPLSRPSHRHRLRRVLLCRGGVRPNRRMDGPPSTGRRITAPPTSSTSWCVGAPTSMRRTMR